MTSATSVAARRRVRLRWGREVLFVVLLVGVLPFFFVSGPHWLATETGRALANLVHIPFFAVLIWMVHTRFALSRPRRWLGAAVVVLVLSVGIELIQAQVGRSSSWHDVWRNLVGSCLAIFWLQRPGRLVWSGRMVATALVVAEVSLAAGVAVSHYRIVSQLPVLADLESAAELGRWHGVNSDCLRSAERASEGVFSLKCYLDSGLYSGMALSNLPHDWSGYRHLSFDLYNPQAEVLAMTLRIYDAHHQFGKRRWEYGDRFNQRLMLRPGWNRVRIGLDAVERSPAGRRMDLRLVQELRLFATGLREPEVVYADNFRLEE